MAARLLRTPGWLSGRAAGTLQMTQFDVGRNKGSLVKARPPDPAAKAPLMCALRPLLLHHSTIDLREQCMSYISHFHSLSEYKLLTIDDFDAMFLFVIIATIDGIPSTTIRI